VLLNYGQIGRRGRLWWRNLLDQYGAPISSSRLRGWSGNIPAGR